jgi:alginate O-acetyltransferase complex protein AlgI
LYVGFFPKLLQGPIERADSLIPQLTLDGQFNYESARSALLLFAWGMFKKVVIADRLALFVNPVFDQVRSQGPFTGVTFLWAAFYFSLQIYTDFSGYTDMAIGLAGLFNLRLTGNFNRPYLATTIAEFWRRWHITFSSWIFDYIFRPLQMKWRRRKVIGNIAALMTTFLVSGIWHGASWGFILWGLLHGTYMGFHVLWAPIRKKIEKSLNFKKSRLLTLWRTSVTFGMVSLAWIFFRTRSVSDAFYMLKHLTSGWFTYALVFASGIGHPNRWKMLFETVWGGGQSMKEFLVLQPVLAAFICFEFSVNFKSSRLVHFFNSNRFFRWSFYMALIISIFVFGINERQKFIYFQF